MSNIHHIHDHNAAIADEQRLDIASDWIAKLDRGLSSEEKHALQLWLAQSSENLAVLLEVANLWDKMEELSRLSDLFPPSVKKNQRSKWLGAIAASVVVAMTLLFTHTALFNQAEQATVVATQMSYQTGIGESNTINLPDKSKIVLNTNSFVQVKYTDKARIIELQRGEIHIDVAHDTSRPLSVIAGGKVIQAVGTAFNVEVRNELVELIVTDGKVLVAKNKLPKAPVDINEMAKKLPVNSMAISKGEKIDLDLTGHVIEKIIKVDAIDLAASLSWRQGNLIFRGESLADAMAEISRYTNVKFELSDDDELREVKVAGMFKTGDVTGLLEVLSRNFNISYQKIASDKIILKYAGEHRLSTS